MEGGLPSSIEPLRLVERNAHLAGELPLSHLTRLAHGLLDQEGRVSVDLRFLTDEEGRPCIRGTVATTAHVVCQRCMEPMSQELSAEINLGLVMTDAEMRALPESLDPLRVGETPVNLCELVEDELILALPLTFLHAGKDCHPAAQGQASPPAPENAFAVLRSLRPRGE